MTWSILCSFILLNVCLSILSPSTAGGRSHAALTPGFCPDCQTFSKAIAVCGGTFEPKDIEIVGEYVLQQPYSKCLCKSVIQQLLWTCAKCEFLNGFSQAKAPPPQKYQTQCIAWGMTIDEWRAPYTDEVVPGTVTDVGAGPNPPGPQPSTPTNNPNPPKPGPSSTGNGGGKPPSSSNPSSPSTTSDNSTNPNGEPTETNSGPNTTAIGISVGIIGVVGVAGAIVVVMMKKKKRRAMRPLDLTDLNVLTDKHARPDSPLGPIASAAPAVIRARDPTPQHQNYEEINHGQGYNGQQQYYEQGSDYGYGQPYDGRRYNEYPQDTNYSQAQGQQQYSDEYYDQQYNHYPQGQHPQYSQPQENYYDPKSSQAPRF
ncbi:hypothetical protein BGZ72_004314 [Mortierella alpina]|nr:hypothetical protein BGZ72_004314 [Mortierella alpina]